MYWYVIIVSSITGYKSAIGILVAVAYANGKSYGSMGKCWCKLIVRFRFPFLVLTCQKRTYWRVLIGWAVHGKGPNIHVEIDTLKTMTKTRVIYCNKSSLTKIQILFLLLRCVIANMVSKFFLGDIFGLEKETSFKVETETIYTSMYKVLDISL